MQATASFILFLKLTKCFILFAYHKMLISSVNFIVLTKFEAYNH